MSSTQAKPKPKPKPKKTKYTEPEIIDLTGNTGNMPVIVKKEVKAVKAPEVIVINNKVNAVKKNVAKKNVAKKSVKKNVGKMTTYAMLFEVKKDFNDFYKLKKDMIQTPKKDIFQIDEEHGGEYAVFESQHTIDELRNAIKSAKVEGEKIGVKMEGAQIMFETLNYVNKYDGTRWYTDKYLED